jgi:c-di-GMP-binding flagellar brake protein YcgR
MNKSLSVYFWRHDDAGYVFDTVVVSDPMASGRALINVSHSSALLRSQKRRSIRVKCSIYAQMYLVKQGDPLLGVLEPEPGMKCLLEDISEDGAMVIIGGKAAKGMRIKLQFTLNEVLIIMVGTVRAVEYNNDANQSRIHFESEELNPRMKNAILAFVYNVLPEEQKEELDAIRLTEEDGREDDGATGPVDLDDESVGKATEAPAETVDLP